MLIDPSGIAMHSHAVGVIPGMTLENVGERSLKEIWNDSAAFQKFRGEDWMQEPCRTCERRSEDFGGCRCQALLLAGDAAATDPACSLAPAHHVVLETLRDSPRDVTSESTLTEDWKYRPNPGRI